MQPREQTVVQSLRELLSTGQARSVRELSVELSASESEISVALEKLTRSLRRMGQELCVEPARCLACGFAFEGRRRSSRPGRCPKCRSSRISRPRFSLSK